MDDHDEDVNNLSFPSDVPKDSVFLFNSEVAVILSKKKEFLLQNGQPIPEVLESTLDYVKRFSSVKNPDDASTEQFLTSLRATLDTQGDYSQPGEPLYQRSLHPFEKAALANMFVSSGSEDPVEEARALVPSLKRTETLGDRFTDEEIESIVNTIREFQDAGPGGGGGGAAGADDEGDDDYN